MPRRILLSLAHPDDESFGSGALISKYVAEGAEVYLICATNGDVGTIAPEMLKGYESHAALRLSELDRASEILGFTKVFKLGYRDSGMMGSAYNEDPECLWYHWKHNPDDVTRRVVEVVREIKPQVIITFNKYGGYGHPDHIAIQQATIAAFDLAADTAYLTEGLSPYKPQKLYYTSFPALLLRISLIMARMRGKNPRRMGVNKDIDMQMILDNAEPVHTKIDISGYFDKWMEANACHASQGGGRNPTIPRWLRNLLGTGQGLTRVYPQPLSNRVDEYDVFAGVSLDDVLVDVVR